MVTSIPGFRCHAQRTEEIQNQMQFYSVVYFVKKCICWRNLKDGSGKYEFCLLWLNLFISKYFERHEVIWDLPCCEDVLWRFLHTLYVLFKPATDSWPKQTKETGSMFLAQKHGKWLICLHKYEGIKGQLASTKAGVTVWPAIHTDLQHCRTFMGKDKMCICRSI